MDTTQKLQDTTPGTQDKPPVKETTPVTKEPTLVTKEPSPSEAPKTHSQEEVNRVVQHAKMEAGRQTKVIEAERDSLRSQIMTKESELGDIKAQRESLDKRIEQLTSNDSEAYNLEKRAKELRDQEQVLNEGRRTHEADKQAQAERVNLAETTLREIAIWNTASEYDGGDPVKLKDLCDTFEAKSEEQIRKVAETLWAKTDLIQPAPPPVIPYSGLTSGGTGFIPDKSKPDETLQHGFRDLKK